MKNLQQKKRNLRNNVAVFILTVAVFFVSNRSLGQDSVNVYGIWEITNMIFVAPPKKPELDDILKKCQHKRIIIDSNRFVLKAPNCFLYKSMNGFEVTKQFVLSYEEAIADNEYAEKTIYYLFDGGQKKTIKGFETNYIFSANDGDVPKLEIFIIDYNHLIINEGENIVFVKRIK